MNPRVEYEMSEQELQELMDACKPTPVMLIGGYAGSGPQENANNAWKKLGAVMGFDAMSVRPMAGKGSRFFTAVPTETPEQQSERESRQREQKRTQDIVEITAQIETLTTSLDLLREGHR